jgi:hypothetical protein
MEVRRMLRIVASEQAEQDALKVDLDALVREGGCQVERRVS